MITITIPASAENKIKVIEKFMEDQLTHNVNLSGAEYEIETSLDQDCVSIDGMDEYAGVELRNSVERIVNPY